MVSVNLIKMPKAAIALLAPSAVALAFFFFVLAKPLLPAYSRERFSNRITISSFFILIAVLGRGAVAMRGSSQTVSEELRYNCQLRAVTSIFSSGSGHRAETDFANAKREIPSFDRLEKALTLKPPAQDGLNHNVVIV
ncbi:MAG: hypothetical protein NTX52_01590, partial [Planctomycetota bacterium]|nr:hypothetical protein [Planctomycetota bacterium]